MKTNLKLKKAIKLRSEQDNLRIKALNQGVELIAPETIFLSKDTTFGKNVKIEPYVVIGSKVKIGNNVRIGAGSVINKDIPRNKLAVRRSKLKIY